MADNPIHILNGDSLLGAFKELDIPGSPFVWREMLCEGPSGIAVASSEFLHNRVNFFKDHYDISEVDYRKNFVSEIKRLMDVLPDADEINLWFEYDLFCHINLFAALSLLQEHRNIAPVFLICSGRIDGKEGLYGLSEIGSEQLQDHFDNRIALTSDDIELATKLWKTFANGNALEFLELSNSDSNFEYLMDIGQAYARSFVTKGEKFNYLEKLALEIIDADFPENNRQLCGMMLRNQGFYGYGDLQIFKIIDRLKPYYEETNNGLKLCRYNPVEDTAEKCYFGGAEKWDFLYDPVVKTLVKSDQ